MSTHSVTNITLVAIGEDHPLAATELAHACGADLDWVVQLVEIGIIKVSGPTPVRVSRPDDWHFYSVDLQNALEARRLQRDFGADLEIAALVLDLQHEVRRLKAALHAQRR